MDIFCTITDEKNDIEERVFVEEWVHGRDTYLLVKPDSVSKSITMRRINGELILAFVDSDDEEHEVVLNKFTGE
jgi:hypothetical protein